MTTHSSTQHGSEAAGQSDGQSERGYEVIEGDWRREEVRTIREGRGKGKTGTGKSNGKGEEIKQRMREKGFWSQSTKQFWLLGQKKLHNSIMDGPTLFHWIEREKKGNGE